eukprot:TRINITY_DN1768_c0_g1_i2.p1 TRINITY_DN1768_c0_g1~~TRINITY_DN1768_c0_g1_i2.p1  ORF type:complete len:200 (+),score=37.43 TRINITY_DN1768_c0_g1_i2:77-676(+)
MSSKIVSITSKEELNNYLSKDTVVEFSAAWCGSCKAVQPKVEELSSKYNKVNFVSIDIDKTESLAKEYDVTSVPTFFFFKDGKVISRFVGASIAEIEKHILSLYTSPPTATVKQRVVKLTEDLAFGVQPTVSELQSLKTGGIKSVINMRETWEKNFIENEKDIVENQGLKYHLASIDVHFFFFLILSIFVSLAFFLCVV